MKRRTVDRYLLATLILLGLLGIISVVHAQGPTTQAIMGSGFNYQGILKDGGTPANGSYELQFELFDAVVGGNQVGNTVTKTVAVTDGQFNVKLDFGTTAFNGEKRFLEIGIRPAGSGSPFTILVPRQELTAVPYALHSRSASALNAADGTPVNAVFVADNGRVGIGTVGPEARLHVSSGQILLDNNLALRGKDISGTPKDLILIGDAHFVENFTKILSGGAGITFLNSAGTDEEMTILDSGNVGIGTHSPQDKLEVFGGNIRVTGGNFIDDGTTLNAPDYVFEEDYPLMPLEELRTYIAQEKHLPNVPSIEEISKDGLNLSQFQMRLLEKTEELTLYTLAQQDILEAQEQQIAELQQQNVALEARLAALEQEIGMK